MFDKEFLESQETEEKLFKRTRTRQNLKRDIWLESVTKISYNLASRTSTSKEADRKRSSDNKNKIKDAKEALIDEVYKGNRRSIIRENLHRSEIIVFYYFRNYEEEWRYSRLIDS